MPCHTELTQRILFAGVVVDHGVSRTCLAEPHDCGGRVAGASLERAEIVQRLPFVSHVLGRRREVPKGEEFRPSAIQVAHVGVGDTDVAPRSRDVRGVVDSLGRVTRFAEATDGFVIVPAAIG